MSNNTVPLIKASIVGIMGLCLMIGPFIDALGAEKEPLWIRIVFSIVGVCAVITSIIGYTDDLETKRQEILANLIEDPEWDEVFKKVHVSPENKIYLKENYKIQKR